MRIGTMMLALAGASLVSLGPALAQGRGGGQGLGQGVGARTDAGIGLGQGRLDGRLETDVRVRAQEDRLNRGIDTRARARAGARAPERASPRAIERADDNSVLRGDGSVRADLSALAPGLVVHDSSGARIGIVSRVLRSNGGVVSNVLVRPDGERRTLRLAPGGLSIDGDVVTTTEVRVGDDD